MLGTIVNAITIIVCSLIGVFLKGGIKEKYRQTIMMALGLAVIYVGASGAISGLLEEGAEPLLFIISLVIGSLIGEWIDIELRLEKLGDFIQEKMSSNDSNISKGFVSASLIFCVGTMAILGSLESGLVGDHTTLYVKSILDGIMSIILASSMGIGVILSSVSVFVYQGLITIFAQVLDPFMTVDVLREINIIGGILISAIGINILEIKKIKVGNMLPAIVIPFLYYVLNINQFFL
ncbi:DUF554 domain-containing protein [Tannockella kyphosi]|uniref:DUF554 domain-containing protein n=1 Tax=Tannockella kyphosi TaxID=2899121 RepID=UPI0020116FE2|nr:DUF554 domain-containing protein [Tannockella kyphosi]